MVVRRGGAERDRVRVHAVTLARQSQGQLVVVFFAFFVLHVRAREHAGAHVLCVVIIKSGLISFLTPDINNFWEVAQHEIQYAVNAYA